MPKYFGRQTEAALLNFPFSGPRVQKEFVYAIARIKKAAALANYSAGILDNEKKNAIARACDELLHGKFDGQFPLSALQGGAGTSTNMCVNEVVAKRATELLAAKRKHIAVHPNDHANKSQSTNDVNPSALKIACLLLSKNLFKSIDAAIATLNKKAAEFKNIQKLGRTHLQDAVPTTLGAEFASYAATLTRDKKRISSVLSGFYELNLGGTAIGNSINASPRFIAALYRELKRSTKLPLVPAKNLMAQTSSQTDFAALSQTLTLFMLDASKMADDLKLLSSGPKGGLGEIRLKGLQDGSSIMPGKVNPVLPEAVNQAYFAISGNNLSIEHAAHAAQLELGVMLPLIVDRLLSSIVLATEVLGIFSANCLNTITANKKRCAELLENSTAYATLLVPKLGYDAVQKIVKESISKNRTIKNLVISERLLTQKEFNALIRKKISQ